MPDKVLLTTLAINVLFLATGAIELGFCLIAQGLVDKETGEDGREAVRHLFYRQFPLTAGIANAALILGTFVFTLPGLASKGRSWLKISGYMVTVCAVFTLCLGVVLWVMTLKVKDDFFPTYLDQETSVQSAIQTTVGESSELLVVVEGDMLIEVFSLVAVAISTPLRRLSSRTRHVPVLRRLRCSAAVRRPSRALPISPLMSSLPRSLAWSVSILFAST